MTEKFIDTAYNTLIHIRNKESESLHRDDFQNDLDNKIDKDQLISFLVKYNFIETEKEDNIYYLTPETYDIIDRGYLDLELWGKVPDKEIEFEHDHEEELIEYEYQTEYNDTFIKWLKYSFYAVLILLISWWIHNHSLEHKNSNPLPLNKGEIEVLKKQLKESLDSLK